MRRRSRSRFLHSTRRLASIVVAVTVLVGLAAPAPAPAQVDPYAADPLRLVPFADTVQRVYSQGGDTWDVWICRVPEGTVPLTLTRVVNDLNAIINPYFSWLSESRYVPVFRIGGEVTSSDPVPSDPGAGEAFQMPGCEAAVAAASTGNPAGALIVVDATFSDGYATAGAFCPEDPFTGCVTTYPDNFRVAVVGAGTVSVVPPNSQPVWSTIAHELGHGVNLPHSYTGLNVLPGSGGIDVYDNPMDLMSGGARVGIPVGSTAFHRYAAGWIEPTDVVFHRSGVATYQLVSIGGAGVQMLVIPLEDGHFYALGARRRVSYDSQLPISGVEVYDVDQRSSACAKPPSWPVSWPCFATLTRVKPIPAETGPNGTAHVLGIDGEVTLGEITVRVEAADANSFTVRVSDTRVGIRFIDDDGNPFETDIETIAALGITKGCNPPLNDRYCPARTVSRAEMAAFLVRSIGEEANLPAYSGLFPDVGAEAWYAPYVERLVQLGITEGYPDGTFRPDEQVTRAQMAAFLVRAFGFTAEGGIAGLFGDVDTSAWYAADVEIIYGRGITLGCASDPLLYCPSDPVPRDQMAAFLARTLSGLG